MFYAYHRSSIVNLQYLKEVRSEADGESTVVFTSGEKIPMSRSYRSRMQNCSIANRLLENIPFFG